MHYQKTILFLLAFILFAAPAYADRDNNRGRGRGHERHDDHRHRTRVQRNTVIVRPSVISIWPSYYPQRPHYQPYYYQPQEVSMTCANGKEVTIRAAGLSIDEMLNRANDFCTAQSGGNLYRIDLPTGNRYCREYQAKVTVGGQNERSYGRACLQPDGSWQIVN